MSNQPPSTLENILKQQQQEQDNSDQFVEYSFEDAVDDKFQKLQLQMQEKQQQNYHEIQRLQQQKKEQKLDNMVVRATSNSVIPQESFSADKNVSSSMHHEESQILANQNFDRRSQPKSNEQIIQPNHPHSHVHPPSQGHTHMHHSNHSHTHDTQIIRQNQMRKSEIKQDINHKPNQNHNINTFQQSSFGDSSSQNHPPLAPNALRKIETSIEASMRKNFRQGLARDFIQKKQSFSFGGASQQQQMTILPSNIFSKSPLNMSEQKSNYFINQKSVSKPPTLNFQPNSNNSLRSQKLVASSPYQGIKHQPYFNNSHNLSHLSHPPLPHHSPYPPHHLHHPPHSPHYSNHSNHSQHAKQAIVKPHSVGPVVYESVKSLNSQSSHNNVFRQTIGNLPDSHRNSQMQAPRNSQINRYNSLSIQKNEYYQQQQPNNNIRQSLKNPMQSQQLRNSNSGYFQTHQQPPHQALSRRHSRQNRESSYSSSKQKRLKALVHFTYLNPNQSTKLNQSSISSMRNSVINQPSSHSFPPHTQSPVPLPPASIINNNNEVSIHNHANISHQQRINQTPHRLYQVSPVKQQPVITPSNFNNNHNNENSTININNNSNININQSINNTIPQQLQSLNKHTATLLSLPTSNKLSLEQCSYRQLLQSHQILLSELQNIQKLTYTISTTLKHQYQQHHHHHQTVINTNNNIVHQNQHHHQQQQLQQQHHPHQLQQLQQQHHQQLQQLQHQHQSQLQQLQIQHQQHLSQLHNQHQQSHHNLITQHNNQHQHQASSLKQTIKQLQQTIHTLQITNKQLDTKIYNYSQSYVKLDQQYHTLQNINNSRQKQYHQNMNNMNNSNISNNNNNINRINQLQIYIGQLQNKINKISQQYQQYKKQIVQLRQQQQQQNNNNKQKYQYIIQSMRQQISMKTNKIQQLTKVIAQNNNSIEQQHSIEQQNRQYTNKQLLQKQQIITKLTQQLLQIQAHANSSVSSKQDIISKMREEYKRIQYQNVQIKQKNNSLIKQISRRDKQQLTNQKIFEGKFQEKINALQKQIRNNNNNNSNNTTSMHSINTGHDITPSRSKKQVSNQNNIEQYQKQIQRLKLQIRNKQQDKRKMQDQLFNQQDTNRRKIMEKQSQIRLLNDQIAIQDEENGRKIREKQRKIKGIEQQLQLIKKERLSVPMTTVISTKKTNQYYQLEQQLQQCKQLLASNKQKYTQLQLQNAQLIASKQQLSKKITNINNNTIKNLEQELSKVTQQLLQTKRSVATVVTLQKQNKSLAQTLNNKNIQILELKGIRLQYNQLGIEMESLKKQRGSLKEMLKMRMKEIQQLQNVNYQLERNRNSSNNNMILNRSQKNILVNNPSIAMDDSQQIQQMTQSIRRKDTQLNKLKQTNQKKASNIEQLQYQIERMRNKLSFAQRNLTHEKQQAEQKMHYLQNRIKQLQLKTKSMDESQRNSKSNYQNQIANLQTGNKDKQQLIRKLQGQIKVHRIKLKGHDSKVQEYQVDIQQLHQKIKQIQAQKTQLKKQINGLEDSGKFDKNHLYDGYQVKIADLQTAATIKDKKMKYLQNTIQTMKLKLIDCNNVNLSEEQLLKNNEQQVQILKKKLADYQGRTLYTNKANGVNNIGTSNYSNTNNFTNISRNLLRGNYRQNDYTNSHVFEQKIIYDLKAENQRLRILLSNNPHSKNNSGNIVSRRTNQLSPIKDNPADNNTYIQRRLTQFNQKLQDMIKANRQLQANNTSRINYGNNSDKQINQIDQLHIKGPFNNPERFNISRMDRSKFRSGNLNSPTHNNSINNYNNYNYQNIIQKHRKQIEQMQAWMIQLHRYCASLQYQPNNNNQSLTPAFSTTINPNTSSSYNNISSNNRIIITDKSLASQQLTYYKTKNKQLQQNVDYHIQLNKQLKTKLQAYLINYSSNNKNNNNNLNKNNNISYYQDQLNKYQKNNSELQIKIKTILQQNQILNRTNKQLREDQSQQIRIIQLQTTISQLNRKLAQNQLKLQLANADITRYTHQIQNMREKLMEYQQDISDKNRKIVQLQRKIQGNQVEGTQTIMKLKNKLNILTQEIQRLNEIVRSGKNNQKEEVSKYSARISQLQQEIVLLQSSNEKYQQQLHSLESKLETNTKTLYSQTNQIFNLKTTLDSQSIKLEQYQHHIDELEQNITNHYLPQSNKQKTINSQLQLTMKQLHQKNTTLIQKYNDKCVDYTKLYELTEKLKDQRERQGDQSKKKLSYISQMEEVINKLKREIQHHKNAHQNANTEIQKLQQQILRLEKQMQKLHTIIVDIQQTMGPYQKCRNQIGYTIQYIRSIFIMVETLIGELQINPSQIQIVKKIREGTQKGLDGCYNAIQLF